MTMLDSLLAAIGGAPALPGAKCRHRHHLFDERGPDEPEDVAEQRHAQALGLCRLCPSLAGCQRWYADLPARHRPTGVIAGIVNSPNKRGNQP